MLKKRLASLANFTRLFLNVVVRDVIIDRLKKINKHVISDSEENAMKMFSQDVTKMSLNTQNLNEHTKINLKP